MTLREFMEAPRMRTALGALGVGVLVIGVALVRAIRPPDVQAATTAAAPTVASLQLPPAPVPTDGDAVAANDIFSTNRKPGRSRYRLPGEKGDVDVQAHAVRQPVVIGTAVGPRPMATVTMSGSGLPARAMRVGDNWDGYIVLAIGNTSVRFMTPAGDTLESFRLR